MDTSSIILSIILLCIFFIFFKYSLKYGKGIKENPSYLKGFILSLIGGLEFAILSLIGNVFLDSEYVLLSVETFYSFMFDFIGFGILSFLFIGSIFTYALKCNKK